MTHSIEKFNVEETIRSSWLRHRGNLAAIKQETGYDLRFIRYVARKFRECMERPEAKMVAETLYKEICFGRNSRIQFLQEMLAALQDRDQFWISMCCDATFRTHTEIEGYKIPITYECMRCHHSCEITLLDRIHIMGKKQDLLRQLKEEDEGLVEFARKMGFVGDNTPAPQVGAGAYKPNILVIQDSSGKQQELIQEISKLDPMDAERVIRKIERALYEDDKLIEEEAKNGRAGTTNQEEETGSKGKK